jgi:hypothetical protein
MPSSSLLQNTGSCINTSNLTLTEPDALEYFLQKVNVTQLANGN